MEKTFTINGKKYTAIPMNFNTVADLSELGLDMMSGNMPYAQTVRAYFALCAGIDKHEAGNEINAHVLAGGNLTELTDVFQYECANSGFMNPEKRTPAIKPVKE